MFNCLVHLFALSICLRLIGCQHLEFGPDLRCERFPELAREQFVFVCDTLLW